MAVNIIKKIPVNEVGVVEYKCLNGDLYKITQHQTSGTYTIYKVIDSGLERLGKGSNPTKLEEKHIKE